MPAELPYQWHGNGEVLVLISGLGGKGRSWYPFLETASKHYSVLIFDLPGSGNSSPLTEPHSIQAFATDTLELLDQLGVENASIVDRSMGGMIAQELALLAPDRVERLALVSTTGAVDGPLQQIFLHWAALANEGVSAEQRHRSSLLWCLGRETLEDEALVERYLQAKSSSDRPKDYAIQALACAEHRMLDRLNALETPTLVVSGTDDRLMPAHHAEALAKTLPNARLSYIPGAGHLPHLEKPRKFEQEVLGHLSGREKWDRNTNG